MSTLVGCGNKQTKALQTLDKKHTEEASQPQKNYFLR